MEWPAGPGQNVTGFIADAATTLGPPRQLSLEQSGQRLHPATEFAGIIHGRPTDGSAELSLYCIDIRTNTYARIGYVLGTWDAATVPNVGYVARILNEYYPNNPAEPAGLTDLNQKAAAVQAAIWYFTDRYVLNTSDPLHNAVAAIVDHDHQGGAAARAATAQPHHHPVDLGAARRQRARAVHGQHQQRRRLGSPVHRHSHRHGRRHVLGLGGHEADRRMEPRCRIGQKIWVRSTGPSRVVLEATAEATVPTGNVYVYDGNTAGVHRRPAPHPGQERAP